MREDNVFRDPIAIAIILGAVFFSANILSENLLKVVAKENFGGNAVSSAIWVGIYGILFALVITKRDTVNNLIDLCRRDMFLMFFILLAILSTIWSISPAVTLKKSLDITGVFFMGAYLATRYDLKQMIKIFAAALTLLAIINLAFTLAYPDYVENNSDAIQKEDSRAGIVKNKNQLGHMMGLNALILLFMLFSGAKNKHRILVFFTLSVFTLIMSESISSIVSLTATLCLAALLIYYKKSKYFNPAIFLSILMIIVMAATFTILNLEQVLNFMGKDLTLTGRTIIWQFSMESIDKKPLLGYGYGAFWIGELNSETYKVSTMLKQEIAHAHNFLLDLLLELGVVGASLFVISFMKNIHYSIRLFIERKQIMMTWPLIFIAFFFISNFTETRMGRTASFILYIAQSLYVRKIIDKND